MASPVVDLLSFALEKTSKGIAERWSFLSAEDLDTELPPTPWVCESIGLAPGPVTIVGGAGFGGKTISMQALLLAVATGKLAWGQFPVRQGAVKHLDWEQGRTLTQRRYQRLAKAMGVRLSDLQGVLTVSSLPAAHLDDPEAERELMVILEGVTLAIIDAFRGAFPKALENDSSARTYLDMLSRVSERTGCTIIVIAHSRKLNASDESTPRSSLRGSSALFDAAQGVLMLDGKKGKPTQVHHEKERIEGELKETFGLAIKDVPDPCLDGGIKWGLAVEYVAPSDLAAAYEDDGGDDNRLSINAARLSTLGNRMLPLIASKGADGILMSTIRGMLAPATTNDVSTVLAEMCQAGIVRCEGKTNSALYFLNREPGEEG